MSWTFPGWECPSCETTGTGEGRRGLLARPAAGRDLTAQDVYDALGESDVFREGYTPVVDRLNGIARPAVARTDGQTPAGERAALIPSIERALFGTTDGDLLDDDSDVPVGELRRLLRDVWTAAPADDTSVQGWGDVESADFIERARAATAVGSFTAQFDHVYDPSGNLVCESVDHSTAVRIAAALSAAPADDTVAPRAYIATLIRADEQDQHDSVDPEVGGPTPEYLRGYRAGVERSAEVAAEALPVPADDTAAPDGPTADEAVASAARIVEAWAHLRMDTPEDQATHDELVRVSRATIAAYVRTRPWSSAGQPVRDSQTAATDD